jgi:hypothetical protein
MLITSEDLITLKYEIELSDKERMQISLLEEDNNNSFVAALAAAAAHIPLE